MNQRLAARAHSGLNCRQPRTTGITEGQRAALLAVSAWDLGIDGLFSDLPCALSSRLRVRIEHLFLVTILFVIAALICLMNPDSFNH